MSDIPHKDSWPWGSETILWGFKSDHQYTFKVLEPKQGRAGCLSLQYHHQKSESWFVLRGEVWALVVVDGIVCTRVMRPGDIQNLPTGVIHRLMGISEDAQVLEPSTPDLHAADKSQPKDVVRLHCVLGRDVSAPRTPQEGELVRECVKITEDAIAAIEQGSQPEQLNDSRLIGATGFSLSEF